MSPPRPYDFTNPDEAVRWFREVEGYLRVSLEDGTDRAGRQHALDALRPLAVLCVRGLNPGPHQVLSSHRIAERLGLDQEAE